MTWVTGMAKFPRPLTIILLGAFLGGCTFSLPVKLKELTNVKETIQDTSRDDPHMTITLHPDGLGWQVFVTQPVTRRTVTEADEYWQYRTYDTSGRSSPTRPENYDDVCGFLLVTTPLLAPMNVEEPPYWTRWHKVASACSMTSVNSSVVLHDRRKVRDEEREMVEAVREGYLSLVWQAPGQAVIQARVALSSNTKSTGTAVRLRWLAEMIRRTTHPPVIPQIGVVELYLVQQDRVVLHRRLSVSPTDLVASLSDDRVISVPADHWPRDIVVRIEHEQESLLADAHAQLIRKAVLTLNRLAFPVVLRGDEFEQWRADQVRFHYPPFNELPSVDSAHAMGATVLLHLAVQTPFPQTRVLTMHMASVETGEILAMLTTGGHESQWPSVVDMGMRELDLMLQHLFQRGNGKPALVNPALKHGGRP
jgi:hypothetical protein